MCGFQMFARHLVGSLIITCSRLRVGASCKLHTFAEAIHLPPAVAKLLAAYRCLFCLPLAVANSRGRLLLLGLHLLLPGLDLPQRLPRARPQPQLPIQMESKCEPIESTWKSVEFRRNPMESNWNPVESKWDPNGVLFNPNRIRWNPHGILWNPNGIQREFYGIQLESY